MGVSIEKMTERFGRWINKLFEPLRPVLVVFKEKHGDTRFVCSDRGELESVCLAKLWERYHMGYYEASRKPPQPPIPKDEVDAMPDGGTKRGAVDEWMCYERACGQHKRTAKRLEMIEAALRSRDGVVAIAVLQCADGQEYEGFEVESAPEIEGPPEIDLLSVKPDWV